MRIAVDNEEYDVWLEDDGTLDTVVSVHHVREGWTQEVRWSTEHGAQYRDEDGTMTDEGFKTLAEESADAAADWR